MKKSSIHPGRIAWKALLIVGVANLAFGLISPPVGRFSLYNHIFPGRLRFNVQVEPGLGLNPEALVFEDMQAMYASHILSAGPKPASEFRVLLLGDSSIWGFNLPPTEILSEQINRLGLSSCNGRLIRVYDIAYPLPSFMRDLLLLDEGARFQPDLIVWPVTLLTFLTRRSDLSFLRNQPDKVLNMVQTYGLRVEASPYLHADTLWDRSLYGQRVRLKKIFIEQLYGLHWTATGMDALLPEVSGLPKDVEPSPAYYEFSSPDDAAALEQAMQFGALQAGYQIAAGTPILIVNEPIYIAEGDDRDIRYNAYYPRWAYDDYRRRIAVWMDLSRRPYADLWNAIPPGEFIDSPLHLTHDGEGRLAKLLAPEIRKLSCP